MVLPARQAARAIAGCSAFAREVDERRRREPYRTSVRSLKRCALPRVKRPRPDGASRLSDAASAPLAYHALAALVDGGLKTPRRREYATSASCAATTARKLPGAVGVALSRCTARSDVEQGARSESHFQLIKHHARRRKSEDPALGRVYLAKGEITAFRRHRAQDRHGAVPAFRRLPCGRLMEFDPVGASALQLADVYRSIRSIAVADALPTCSVRRASIAVSSDARSCVKRPSTSSWKPNRFADFFDCCRRTSRFRSPRTADDACVKR